MSTLLQLPQILMQAAFFLLWGMFMFLAFNAATSTQKGMAVFMVVLWVGLHLLAVNSGFSFFFEPILNLPINIYIKDVIVIIASLVIAITVGTEGVWTGTLIALPVEVIGYGLIVGNLLRF